MSSYTEHMQGWGVPSDYIQDEDVPPISALYEGDPLPGLVSAVSRAANWYPEQDAAVRAMVRARDAAALRSWDRDCLVEIGKETAFGGEYAEDVMAALSTLADAVEERKIREDATANDLVLCRSDHGDGGWSLHAPGAADEEIAHGDAPVLLAGPAGSDDDSESGWTRPNAADYERALRVLRGEEESSE